MNCLYLVIHYILQRSKCLETIICDDFVCIIDPSWSFVTFELNCGSTADDAVVTWQISSDAYNYFTDVLVQFEYNCTDIRGYSEVRHFIALTYNEPYILQQITRELCVHAWASQTGSSTGT